jgi:two-component system response regulator MtrA
MTTNGGRLLLILASTDTQTLPQLTSASGLRPAETLGQLESLVQHGFIVAAAPNGAVAAYRLNPKGVRSEAGEAQPRILLIEDDLAVQDLMTLVLEEDGYGVIAVQTPADAQTLLREVAFDLVITDGFSQSAEAVLASADEMLTAAGVTPVALSTAHQIELDDALAAGFRDLVAKPFDIYTLAQQVRVLLRS